MKIIEEAQLKETIEQLNIYASKNLGNDLYLNIDNVKIKSLQDYSFKNDEAFFDKISFILSVISSIIAHPFISNKGEDVIVRADQAGHIPPSAIQDVFKDTKLWKEKNLEMVPEYVHYHQYTDELRIYENLFIGMLINLIDNELTKYRVFYVSLIPSVDDDFSNFLDNKKTEKALKVIEHLKRKIRFIKNTYFYKEVSKGNLNFKNVQPTNILLKNRLYNQCFKFYRSIIKYSDQVEITNDLKLYYSYLVLKTFKSLGFVINTDEKSSVKKYQFKYNDYYVNYDYSKNNSAKLTIKYGRFQANHALYFKTSDEEENFEFDSDALSNQVISIWNLYDESGSCCIKNYTTEEELIKRWILSKFNESYANKTLYKNYCPICKSKNIDCTRGLYKCAECNSMYVFKSGIEKNKIWYLKYKR